MGTRPRGAQALDRAIALLSAIVAAKGERSVNEIATEQGLAISTANRMVALLVGKGMLLRTGPGKLRAGFALVRLAAATEPCETVCLIARPLLRKLARRTGRAAHLGILEADMVTYLVKESPAAFDLFTRETMQLEAYCSAIGKVLLAELPERARETYLATGTFVPLTRNTLVDPQQLHQHLAEVSVRGYAIDKEEIADNLFCIAAPVRVPAGCPCVAISLAGHSESWEGVLEPLRETSRALAHKLAGGACRATSCGDGPAR